GQPLFLRSFDLYQSQLLDFLDFTALRWIGNLCSASDASKQDGTLSTEEALSSTSTSKGSMRLLRFFEEFSQFFRTPQDQVVYVNVTTDLIHQAVASFGNQTRIGATVILRHRNISLVENSSHNINGFFSNIQCPSRKAMSKQVWENC